MNEVSIGLVAAFMAGIFSFLSPCVLPLVPSYLALVTGMSLEDLQEGVNRKATFIHSLLFVLGFSAIFIILGASASFLGQFFKQYELWIARIGGVIIIIFGLHLSGVFKLAPLMREKRIHVSDTPAGYLGTIGVGMAFAAGWTPCLGPVLGAILTYGMSTDTMWAGVGLLTAYSAGLAIPFLVASLALDAFLQGFKRFRRWIPVVEKASGLMLIGLGVLLLTGQLTALTAMLARFTPDWIVNRI
ncbi:MAG TPA: cytochrome C biogenesis protein [Gemmatimonadetes bacterium]|nr:cytochrome C biogenesis protein [Gemmatimonadota bacterium]HBD99440.1 cytochrome C biogenesis protein [Gemmatimonadota bacterium]HIC54656.1 cytochrome c biogenesis protein CcdA [Gemmatimonadota bacterium]HIN51189.1 cytochrome c biogenesis protein CcdA [Gemmatimonadota bacterium]